MFDFIKKKPIQVAGVIFVILSAWFLMKSDLRALEVRVNAVEETQATYPSQDWFELKFEIIEDHLESIK